MSTRTNLCSLLLALVWPSEQLAPMAISESRVPSAAYVVFPPYLKSCTSSITSNKEEREEGGTPDILGSIRLGLAVQMKEQLGRQALQVRFRYSCCRCLQS